MSDRPFDASALPELSASQTDALGELQAEEIESATIVYDCGGWDTAIADTYDEVRIEHEERFLDENADRLIPFRG